MSSHCVVDPNNNNFPRSYSLELYYRNESTHEPYPNPVPGCNGLNPCPLTLFSDLVRDVLVDDWEAECGFTTKWSSTGQRSHSFILGRLLMRLFGRCTSFRFNNVICVLHRSDYGSCSGSGTPGGGALVQHRGVNGQKEGTLLQGGVMQVMRSKLCQSIPF